MCASASPSPARSASGATTRRTRASATTPSGSRCASTARGAASTRAIARPADVEGYRAVARDRKRAKQRRDRARRTAGGTAVSPRARREDEVTPDAAPPVEPAAGPAGDPVTEHDEHVPLSLEHASADVDIAEAQLAAGYTDEAPFDGEEDDGFI